MKKSFRFFCSLAIFSLFALNSYGKQPANIANDLPPVFYPDSYHVILSVSALADIVCLDDESAWALTQPNKCVLEWKITDPTTILPNECWFCSSYGKYILKNLLTKECVYVNLYLAPKLKNENTLFIKSIDKDHSTITLTNGFTWKVHPKYKYMIDEWEITDAVIIGTANEQVSWSEYLWYGNRPEMDNIIINACMDEYVKAQKLK